MSIHIFVIFATKWLTAVLFLCIIKYITGYWIGKTSFSLTAVLFDWTGGDRSSDEDPDGDSGDVDSPASGDDFRVSCAKEMALLALMEKTGYNMVQENGQRKYGGPPPGTPQSGTQTSIIHSNISKYFNTLEPAVPCRRFQSHVTRTNFNTFYGHFLW